MKENIYFIIFVFFLLCTLLILFQNRSIPELYIKKQLIDLGKIDISNRTVEFKLENIGNGVLNIKTVMTSCDCLTSNKANFSLKASEQAILSLNLDLSGKKGPLDMIIRLVTNIPENKIQILRIKAIVSPSVYFTESIVFMKNIPPSAIVSRDVILTSKNKNTVLTGISCNSRFFKIESIKIIDNYQKKIRISSVPPLPKEVIYAILEAKLEMPEKIKIPLKIIASVKDEVKVNPRELRLDENEKKEMIRVIELNPGSIKKFRITQIKTPFEDITSEIIYFNKKNKYKIQLKIPPVRSEFFGKYIVINTDISNADPVKIKINHFPN